MERFAQIAQMSQDIRDMIELQSFLLLGNDGHLKNAQLELHDCVQGIIHQYIN